MIKVYDCISLILKQREVIMANYMAFCSYWHDELIVLTVYDLRMTVELLVVVLSLQPSNSLGLSRNAPSPPNRSLYILKSSFSSVGWQQQSISNYPCCAQHVVPCPCEFYLAELSHDSSAASNCWATRFPFPSWCQSQGNPRNTSLIHFRYVTQPSTMSPTITLETKGEATCKPGGWSIFQSFQRKNIWSNASVSMLTSHVYSGCTHFGGAAWPLGQRAVKWPKVLKTKVQSNKNMEHYPVGQHIIYRSNMNIFFY